MGATQELLLDEEMPSNLMPQPEKGMSLSMEKQGLCPPRVEELALDVFQMLTAGMKSN